MKTKIIVKIVVGIIVIGGGIGYFMYQAMQSSWSYYYPVDKFIASDKKNQEYSFRIAGKVKSGTIKRDLQKMDMEFTLHMILGIMLLIIIRYLQFHMDCIYMIILQIQQ